MTTSNEIEIRAGNSARLRVEVWDETDPDEANWVEVPVAPTDRVICTIVSSTFDGATPLIVKDSVNIGEIEFNIGGDSHVIDVILTAADSVNAGEGDYLYDIKIIFASSGEEQTAVMDNMVITRPPTTIIA